MTIWKRAGAAAAATGALVVLAACSAGSQGTSRTLGQPEQLQPVQSGTVASANLPTIGQGGVPQPTQLGAPATPQQVNPALTGQPVLGGTPAPLQTANADGSFVSLDSVGSVPAAPGRDLSGGLTIEKLLGGWTVVSGAEECKLNLTYTAKAGTSRYRASTPACNLPGLAVVASWQLAGSQVQLFDENGDMIAALILSGDRFIGTLAGGQGISMAG
mgnify:CR=1 FL=1